MRQNRLIHHRLTIVSPKLTQETAISAPAAKSTAMEASSPGTWARRGLWFSLLAALFLLPALLNGFPFVMEDSIAYSGQGINWMRPPTAAVLASPLYPALGYWSLPVISAVLAAAAWIIFCVTFEAERWLPLALPVAVLTLQPVYTSAVLTDALFFPAIVFLMVAIKRRSPAFALLAGILLSCHGSGAILAAVFALILVAFFRTRSALLYGGLALATTLACGIALQARFTPDTPQLGKTFLAARLFSVEPSLLADECDRSGDQALCTAQTELEQLKAEPGNAGRRDLFWDLQDKMGSRFDLATFERLHALPIILHGLAKQPWKFAQVALDDWLSFYTPGTVFDFRARLGEPMPQAYDTSLQKRGMMESPPVTTAATILRFGFYLFLIAALVIRRGDLKGADIRWIGAILLLCLANDILFAIVSGPPDRYHHRILPIAALALMIAWSARTRAAAGAQAIS